MRPQIEQLDKQINELISQLELNLRQYCRLNDEIYMQADAIRRTLRDIKKEASIPTNQSTIEAVI